MNITNWFDPNNKDHIEAYYYLLRNGSWPQDFMPEDVQRPVGWDVSLAYKMCDCWVKYMMKKHD